MTYPAYETIIQENSQFVHHYLKKGVERTVGYTYSILVVS